MFAETLARIEKRLTAVGLSASRAGKLAGAPDAIRDLRRAVNGKDDRRRGISVASLTKLAPVLDTSVGWLMTGEGEENSLTEHHTDAERGMAAELEARRPKTRSRQGYGDIPILGTAAGSLGQGAFEISDPIDHIQRPPSLMGAPDVYAIYVKGDSMAPEHKAESLRIVHPSRPVRAGDTVIIQARIAPDEPIQSYIKHFVRRTEQHVVCQQINPVATIRYNSTNVAYVHKVLSQNELFGR